MRDILPREKTGTFMIQNRRIPDTAAAAALRKEQMQFLVMTEDAREVNWSGQKEILAEEAVITSYSIHYTKLYDLKRDREQRQPLAGPVDAKAILESVERAVGAALEMDAFGVEHSTRRSIERNRQMPAAISPSASRAMIV